MSISALYKRSKLLCIAICVASFVVAYMANVVLMHHYGFFPEKIESESYDMTVLYTKRGYVPAFLRIAPGTRVSFENITDTPVWTVSDSYEAYPDYSGFDSNKEYGKGEKYLFTFERTGTFGFYNKKEVLHHGVVSVVDSTVPSSDISKTVSYKKAVRDELIALLVEGDPTSVFKVVDEIEKYPHLALNCHEIAHDIGHKAYELYGFSGAMNFSEPGRANAASVQDICGGGYVHGILEEVSIRDSNFDRNPGQVCENVPDSRRDGCFHGIGHALMLEYKGDIPRALASCKSFKTNTDTYRCFEGVWMEMFLGKAQWDTEKPFDMCISTLEEAKPTCFMYSSIGYIHKHAKKYTEALHLCVESDFNESDKNFCLKGVGISVGNYILSKDFKESDVNVSFLLKSELSSFYEGLVGYVTFLNVTSEQLNTICTMFGDDTGMCKRLAVKKNF